MAEIREVGGTSKIKRSSGSQKKGITFGVLGY